MTDMTDVHTNRMMERVCDKMGKEGFVNYISMRYKLMKFCCLFDKEFDFSNGYYYTKQVTIKVLKQGISKTICGVRLGRLIKKLKRIKNPKQRIICFYSVKSIKFDFNCDYD